MADGHAGWEAYHADDPGPHMEEVPHGETLSRPEIIIEDASARRSKRQRAQHATPADLRPYFSFDDSAWTEADIAPRPWIAPGYLLRGAITAVIGPGAAGKSSLLVSWAVSLAFGVELERFRPQHAVRVLLLNTEDGENEQRRRLTVALKRIGRKPADLAGKIARVSSERFAPLFGKDEDGAVDALPAMEELDKMIEEFGPTVVVLDPLIDLHTVEENANVEMREVMTHLRALAVKHQISIVVAHHTRKGFISPGDSDAARGASAIRDLARIAVTVTPMTEEDAGAFGVTAQARPYYFRLDDAKANYAPLGAATWFERVSCLLANGDHVAAAHPWTPPDDAIATEQRTKIEIGIAIGSSEGPWSPKLSDDARSFRQLCLQNDVTSGKAQNALLKSLLKDGFDRAKFRKPGNRAEAAGLRAPDGRPAANWIDDEGGSDD